MAVLRGRSVRGWPWNLFRHFYFFLSEYPKGWNCRSFVCFFNPNYPGGGRNHHPLSETRDCSGTEHPLDLRPVCKFKFVRCLETHKFFLSVWAMLGPCRALFYQGSSEICLAGSIFGSIWGSMKVQEGPLSLGRVG